MDGELYIVFVIAPVFRDGVFINTVFAQEFTFDKRYS